jgi:nucleoside-diphosphate-sugar epimerase
VIRMGEAPQILVRGATGFIGTHLVGKLAEEGRPTRCLVRGSSLKVARDHLSRFEAELVYEDLTDSGSLGAATEGVTTVFNLGGGGTVQMTSMDDYLRINVDATRDLLDAASDDPKRHAAKLVRQLQAIGYRVTLEEVEAAEHSRHLHYSPSAVVR